jgi:hypothetical protein
VLSATQIGALQFDAAFHGPDDSPSLSRLADDLMGAGLRVNADTMAEAFEGFEDARDEYYLSR